MYIVLDLNGFGERCLGSMIESGMKEFLLERVMTPILTDKLHAALAEIMGHSSANIDRDLRRRLRYCCPFLRRPIAWMDSALKSPSQHHHSAYESSHPVTQPAFLALDQFICFDDPFKTKFLLQRIPSGCSRISTTG